MCKKKFKTMKTSEETELALDIPVADDDDDEEDDDKEENSLVNEVS